MLGTHYSRLTMLRKRKMNEINKRGFSLTCHAPALQVPARFSFCFEEKVANKSQGKPISRECLTNKRTTRNYLLCPRLHRGVNLRLRNTRTLRVAQSKAPR